MHEVGVEQAVDSLEVLECWRIACPRASPPGLASPARTLATFSACSRADMRRWQEVPDAEAEETTEPSGDGGRASMLKTVSSTAHLAESANPEPVSSAPGFGSWRVWRR